MPQEPSIIKKGERVFDDLGVLWRRRPRLCFGIVIVLISPSLVLLADKFWGRSDLVSQISTLKEDLVDTKRDRNAKATQLAPFLAAANQHFESSPPDKRLDLLLDRFDSLAQLMRDTASRIPTSRVISPDGQARIKAKLATAPRIPISITAPLGDAEAFELAQQIKTLFEDDGFKVDGISQGVWTKPPRGLILQCKRLPDGILLNAFLQLFIEVGSKPTASIIESMPESDISIIVGSK
jgi:hypothetical protein